MDIDEVAYREGRLSARLYGYLKVPYERSMIQATKSPSVVEAQKLKEIAEYVVDGLEEGCIYLLGPGTTVRAVADELGIPKTLLGVDILCGRRLIASDVNEDQILKSVVGRRVKAILSVIGSQGYILGRGNQQISSDVLRRIGKENIIVIATEQKLAGLQGPLLTDVGDQEIDRALSGWIRVITGYRQEAMWEVAN